MADDKTTRGSPDRDRIGIEEKHELRQWSKGLGISVSKEELVAAVRAVGNSAEKVRQHLKEKNKSTASR